MTAVFVAIGVLAALAGVQALLTRRDRSRSASPGTMVNRLHVVEMGSGLPAVVFESGIANSSLSWTRIQPKLAEFTATYSYDRAGLGWSRSTSNVCSLENLGRDLRAVVEAAHVSKPFILVGHSFGGYIARYYADRFPRDLAGLVLLDPATPEEWMKPTRQQRWRLRRAVFFTRATGVLACFGVVRFGLWLLLLRKKETPGPISRFSTTLQRIRFELRKIPAEALPSICAHWSRPGFYWVMAAYLKAVPTCAEAASKCSLPPQLPITVLSGAHQPPERLAEHAAIATRHIIAAQSAHFIHLDEPEMVVDAIRDLLKKAVPLTR